MQVIENVDGVVGDDRDLVWWGVQLTDGFPPPWKESTICGPVGNGD